MSVYTRVKREQLEQFISEYSIGELVEYEGITAGIENTNYFVTTTGGRYVLTLFESLSMEELPYFLDLTAHLSDGGVPCPHPVPDNQKHYLKQLNGKPAAFVTRLQGRNVDVPNIEQVTALGKQLGHMHVAGSDFVGNRKNNRGPHWWIITAELVMPKLGRDDVYLLENEINYQKQHAHDALPQGVIHADLFRDNVMFTDNELTGIIDFYYACNDVLLYDIAVTINDWCSNSDGSLDEVRAIAFLRAYNNERKLTDSEHKAWPVMLRAGALRFWLSRLKDMHFPRDGELTHTKNPDIFKQILLDRIQRENSISSLWP